MIPAYQFAEGKKRSRHRFTCQHCGRGFLTTTNSKNGTVLCCTRARCEKKSGIYIRPKHKQV